MRVVTALLLLIIEESFFAAHPLDFVDPVKYFGDDKGLFLLMVVLLFGIGYPLSALILSEAQLSLRGIIWIIILGLIEWVLITPRMIILVLGLMLLLKYFIGRRQWMGYALLGTAFFLIAVPLLILFMDAETFMDVAAFQQTTALYQSHHYSRYIINQLMHPDFYIIMTALFMILPLQLIGPDIRKRLMKHRYIYAVCLVVAGLIVKSLVIHSESVIIFHVLIIIGGLLQAAAFYLILPAASTALIPCIFIAQSLILVMFTGIGTGHYQLMTVSEVLTKALIIFGITLTGWILVNFIRKKSVKA